MNPKSETLTLETEIGEQKLTPSNPLLELEPSPQLGIAAGNRDARDGRAEQAGA
jgi:hypothetical protein